MDREELTEKLSTVYDEPVKLWGPYFCKDGRYRTDLVLLKTQISKTNLHARLVLEAKLGRKLKANETVDHNDNDKTNDSVDNLQVLTLAENARKSANPNPLIERSRSLAGSGAMGKPVRGENNGQAKLSDTEVKEIRQGFLEFGGLDLLVKELPLSKRSIRSLLEGTTYQDVGGPRVTFKPRCHGEELIDIKLSED